MCMLLCRVDLKFWGLLLAKHDGPCQRPTAALKPETNESLGGCWLKVSMTRPQAKLCPAWSMKLQHDVFYLITLGHRESLDKSSI